METITLNKAGHTNIIRYEKGDEGAVMEHLVEKVNRQDVPFDWFDAAVMSHQLGQKMAAELKAMMPQPKDKSEKMP